MSAALPSITSQVFAGAKMFIKKLQRTLRQTGRLLQTRYKEHVRSIKYIKDYTKYIRNVLNNQYLFGKIEEIMGKTDNI